MSWSITFIGKPENVANALEQYSEKLSGQSKIEYDSALPHFIALTKENFGSIPQVLKITASGHGQAGSDGEQIQRQCIVSIELFYGTLV